MREEKGMDRRKNRTAAGVGFCLFLILVLFATAAAVYHIAGDGSLMAAEMRRHTSPEMTGLPDEQYPGMGQMIAEYLTGDQPVFQYSFSDDDGNLTVCFQVHEVDHMADCRQLIGMAGRIRWILAAAALVLIGTGAVMRKQRRSFAAGMIMGFGLSAAACIAILIWGYISFDSLFTVFHKLLFTNDGWILDTRTDMLIRLMPTSFFISLGIKVLLSAAAMAFAAFGAAVIIRAAGNKSGKNEGEKIAENQACEA